MRTFYILVKSLTSHNHTSVVNKVVNKVVIIVNVRVGWKWGW